MIWALLALYLFGSWGTSDFTVIFERAKTSIKAEILDSARRKELIAIVEVAEKTTKEQVNARGKVVKELSSLTERHDTKKSDIQTVLEGFRVDDEAYQNRMIKHRFELKGKMTREEWAKVFPAQEQKPMQNS